MSLGMDVIEDGTLHTGSSEGEEIGKEEKTKRFPKSRLTFYRGPDLRTRPNLQLYNYFRKLS
jgi:hypothetical protein